ncbi:hypothetical protein GE061_005235 [Apolygus lucorum]|uniref:Glutaminyl-peptide cyclotransferase n=1 Tax=Apolygus lucorum TaxID=248454 RepID=A0A6A4J5D9_APOLU|nr:hypothetical protein GE061_005235 [Apolygus lucorum]
MREERRLHSSKSMSNNELKEVALLTDDAYFRSALSKILVPRVVGTPSHENVRNFIVGEFQKLGWTVELDQFRAMTPTHGALDFANIIARFDTKPARELVLACHYDSKYFREFEFVGATDSAVPCAMLLHLAKVLTPYLHDQKVGLVMIFFDGEEAFYEWSDNDSIYGARNLAAKWERQAFNRNGLQTNELERIDMMVLLDLIGKKDQQFTSFFRDTQRWHSLLAKIETKLKALGLISPDETKHFLEKSSISFIDDDHKPFLNRQVPILHVIPARFPKEWHTAADNYQALDFRSIDSMNKIFQVFVYAYMHGSLQEPIPGGGTVFWTKGFVMLSLLSVSASVLLSLCRWIY